MRRPPLARLLVAQVAALLLPGVARGQSSDATLTVNLKNGGVGAFNKSNSIGTEVRAFAESQVAARYNGPTNVYAPTVGVANPGATFTARIDTLYSPVKVPNNKYLVRLEWDDTAKKSVALGPYVVPAGASILGAGGIGSATPIEVKNDPPPASTGLKCYADVPDKSTNLYLYWSGTAFYVDRDATELYLSTMPGFVPSAPSRIATLPFGTTFRKLPGLSPGTNYYYCVREIDRYGATTDTCLASPCTTDGPMMAADLTVLRDLALAADLAAPVDLAAADLTAGKPDLAAAPPDLAATDLAMAAGDLASADLAAEPADLAMSAPDLAVEAPDRAPPLDLSDAVVDGGPGAPDLAAATADSAGLGDLAPPGGDAPVASADGAPLERDLLAGADLAAADLGPGDRLPEAGASFDGLAADLPTSVPPRGCSCVIGANSPRSGLRLTLLALLLLALPGARRRRVAARAARAARAGRRPAPTRAA